MCQVEVALRFGGAFQPVARSFARVQLTGRGGGRLPNHPPDGPAAARTLPAAPHELGAARGLLLSHRHPPLLLATVSRHGRGTARSESNWETPGGLQWKCNGVGGPIRGSFASMTAMSVSTSTLARAPL